MNKLLTKIVGLSLGLSMAIGVGVAASYSEKDAVRADAANVTDTIDGTTCSSWKSATTSWHDDSYTGAGSGLVYHAHYMGGGNNADGRTFAWNANGYLYANGSTTRDLVSITITTSANTKTIGVYASNTPYNAAPSGTALASLSANTSGATYSFTSSYKYLALKGTASSTFIKSISVVYGDESSTPEMDITKSNVYVATTTVSKFDVSYANLTQNISVNQSGTAVSLSTDGETYSSTLTLDKSLSSPQTIYVKGSTVGISTLTLSSTGVSDKTCTVHVESPMIFEKIDSAGLMKDGGKYILSATETDLVMSTNQLTNGRTSVETTFIDDKIHTTSVCDEAILVINKGTGTYADYFTIFDPAYGDNGGYLEYYKNNLTTYYVSSTPTSDAFYWSISFSNNHVVLENKTYSGYYLEYNASSSANYFRLYAGTQTKIDLYELTSDIPSVTYLSSITAANVTVGEGSTITYSGSYEPANATVSITATLGSDIATLGEITMSSGTFTVSITGTTSGSTTLTLSGPSSATTTTSATPTLTVSSYTATHTLVTASSSLDNGSKVVFGSQYNPETESEKYAISGAAHTGGDYVPVVSTAYNSTKTTLAAAVSTKEYTMWCIDSTNGYWVLSDGGYFLSAPASAGNKLQRTNQLSDRCYFLIEDNTAGIVVKSYYAQEQHWQYQGEDVDYTIQYNYNSGTNSRFALYRAESQTVSSLYLSNQSLNRVQGFIDAFMHFGNVPHNPLDPDTGHCKDSGYGYFTAALNAYNQLTPSEQEDFCTESEYANAYDRFSDWASANGYSFNGYTLEQDARLGLSIFGADNQISITVIVIIAAISVTSIGALLVLKKRKEQF